MRGIVQAPLHPTGPAAGPAEKHTADLPPATPAALLVAAPITP
jgi:hypothetical protein